MADGFSPTRTGHRGAARHGFADTFNGPIPLGLRTTQVVDPLNPTSSAIKPRGDPWEGFPDHENLGTTGAQLSTSRPPR
jgi:hypothetical protein